MSRRPDQLLATAGARGPGRPRVLTEVEVVDAAERLARDHGVARVSMRAVARELDVPPMTIYGYVPNKDALDALLFDRILSGVRVPEPDEGPWEERLRVLLTDARRTLVERPQLAESRASLAGNAVQLLHRGAFGQEASRLAEAVLDLLREGGFHPDDRHVCFVTLFTYVTGHLDPAGTAVVSSAAARGGGRSSPLTSEAIFALGAEALIEGLKATLRDH